MPARVRVLALLCALGAPSLAPAQQTPASPSAAGPRLEAMATAFRAPAVTDSAAAAAQRSSQRSLGKPVALMVVGGAAIVLGAVIGDAPGTLFMIGGAATFLYGLYHYLQ